MAIIPGLGYDLFISYAHADNIAAEDGEGWVTSFVNRLRAALAQRLGAAQDLTIFRDDSEMRANSRLPDLLTATRSSALFLVIGSPSYVAHDWTKRELAAFIQQNQDPTRLFLVELLPLDSGEDYPPPLNENMHIEFWKPSGPRQIPMPLSLHADWDEFSRLIHILAADIRNKLFDLR